MEKHTPFFELRDSLAEGGCAICRLGQRTAAQYIQSLLYEYANKPPTHKQLRRARGYCHAHAWQLSQQHGAVTSLAILNRTALKSSLEVLQKHDETKPSAGKGLRSALGVGSRKSTLASITEALEPEAPCPICATQEESEISYLNTLLKHVDDPEIVSNFEQAGGLCWPHLRLALQQTAGKAHIQRLLTMQRAAAERLLAELDEFIRKQDYRFRDEPIGTEGDSWLRAIALNSGLKDSS